MAAVLDRLTAEDVRKAKEAAVALRPRRSFQRSAAVVQKHTLNVRGAYLTSEQQIYRVLTGEE